MENGNDAIVYVFLFDLFLLSNGNSMGWFRIYKLFFRNFLGGIDEISKHNNTSI